MLRALWVSFVLSVGGTVFSGVLAYRELFGPTALACPSPGAAGTIFGYPACVYGFGMFALVALSSGAGLVAATRQPRAPMTQAPAPWR